MGDNFNHEIKYSLEALLKTNKRVSKLQLLGEGSESNIFTDYKLIYKVFINWNFGYTNFLPQLLNVFNKAKYFVNPSEYFELNFENVQESKLIQTNKSFPVIAYEYFDSKLYEEGYREQLIEFLIECFNLGIVCWDIKPTNFRLRDSELVFVDIGHDIKPLTMKDFVLMCQRTFLMLHYGKQSNFRQLANETRRFWISSNLKGFNDFFNQIWKVLWERGIVESPKLLPMNIQSSKQLFIQKFSTNIVVANTETSIFLKNTYNIPSDLIHICSNVSSLSMDFLTESTMSEDNLIIFSRLQLSKSGITWISSILSRSTKNSKNRVSLIIPNIYEAPDGDQSIDYLIVLFKLKLSEIGYYFDSIEESPSILSNTNLIGFKYSIFSLKPIILSSNPHIGIENNVSLMIKVCYQDADILEKQILHILNQLAFPRPFNERYVIVDSKEDSFLRQFNKSKKEKIQQILDKFVEFELITDVYLSPTDVSQIRDLNYRWFNISTEQTHSIRNIPIIPQIYGFELAKSKYILQMDVDVFVGRYDELHDYLDDMINALDNDQALSVGFNIAHCKDSKPNPYSGDGEGGFVPEVRFGLLDKLKFLKYQPYPNKLDERENRLELSWYRSVEQFQVENGFESLRGGNPRSFYIHPPNTWKADLNHYFLVQQKVESLIIPSFQFDNLDLTGAVDNWLFPKRTENFVFVICGRNVSVPKFKRCWTSIQNQTRGDWGAIIVDDSSTNTVYSYIHHYFSQYHRDRVTYYQTHSRKGILYNIYLAITQVCTNPYSVVVIVDMDDFLLSNDVLELLYLKYMEGIEVTIGNTLRHEKGIYEYAPELNFPRNERMGDVWLHVRTFRKYLFDMISLEDFKQDGNWIDRFTELTYLVPIMEMATKKHYFQWPLYYWQPMHPRNTLHYEKTRNTIAFMLNKSKYTTLQISKYSDLLPLTEMIKLLSSINGSYKFPIFIIRHAEKVHSFNDEFPNRKDRISEISENGIKHCQIIAPQLETVNLPVRYLTSISKRTIDTATYIHGNSHTITTTELLRGLPILDEDGWLKEKRKLNRIEILQLWKDGKIPTSIISDYSEYIWQLRDLILSNYEPGELLIIVSHDHIIQLLLWEIKSLFVQNVPYLQGGMFAISEFSYSKTFN